MANKTYAGFGQLKRQLSRDGGKSKRIKGYTLPLPAHGWRGGGERGDNEIRPVSPRKGHPRGKHYSDSNRPT